MKLQEAAANSPTAQLSAGTQALSLRSTPQALALLAQRHGWRCLFAGLSINYLKVGVAGDCCPPLPVRGTPAEAARAPRCAARQTAASPGCRALPLCCPATGSFFLFSFKSKLPHPSAQVVPSTAIGFTIYDYMKSALALPTNL